MEAIDNSPEAILKRIKESRICDLCHGPITDENSYKVRNGLFQHHICRWAMLAERRRGLEYLRQKWWWESMDDPEDREKMIDVWIKCKLEGKLFRAAFSIYDSPEVRTTEERLEIERKAKTAAQARAYRASFDEDRRRRFLETKRVYREAQKEKAAKREKKYIAANAEQIAERNRAYRFDNIDRLSKQRRDYYSANKKQYLDAKRLYRLSRAEIIADRSRAIRVLKKEGLYQPATTGERKDMIKDWLEKNPRTEPFKARGPYNPKEGGE